MFLLRSYVYVGSRLRDLAIFPLGFLPPSSWGEQKGREENGSYDSRVSGARARLMRAEWGRWVKKSISSGKK